MIYEFNEIVHHLDSRNGSCHEATLRLSSTVDLNDLYVKDESGVGRDTPCRKSSGAIAHVRSERETRPFSLGHRQNAQIPAANHLTGQN